MTPELIFHYILAIGGAVVLLVVVALVVIRILFVIFDF